MGTKVFNILLVSVATVALLLLAGVFFCLFSGSLLAFEHFGVFNFLFSSEWNTQPGAESYGALPFITGTLLTSVLALAICIPFSLSIVLFNNEMIRGKYIAKTISRTMELFSNIPTIILGVWGYHALRPVLESLNLGNQGFGILTASIVLAIMIIPYTATLISSFINKVPQVYRESAVSLGATRFEAATKITFPLARRGIIASFVLAFGKVFGETIIVTLLIGNAVKIPENLLDTGSSMASILTTVGGSGELKTSSMFAVAFILFLLTAVINYAAQTLLKKPIR